MQKQMYALLDHTAQIFLNPITFINDKDAIRWFGSVVNAEDKTNVSQHPEQFTLFRLADYDDKLGTYAEAAQPQQIITGIQVQDEQLKKFTVADLIGMLKTELHLENVIDIADNKAEG